MKQIVALKCSIVLRRVAKALNVSVFVTVTRLFALTRVLVTQEMIVNQEYSF